jgi:hypothetical protein
MPKSWQPRLLQSQAANHRADLETIIEDLDHVAKCCDLLLTRGIHPLGDIEAKALFDSIATRYRRCFNSGARKPLDRKDLQGEDVERHAFFYAIADKHIAHSVNGFGLRASTVYIAVDDRGQLHRGGLGSQGSSTLELSLHDIAQFSEFVGELIADAKAVHASLSERLKLEVVDMSDEQLRDLPEGFAPLHAKMDVLQRRQWPKPAKS